jgi:hypothetical protein
MIYNAIILILKNIVQKSLIHEYDIEMSILMSKIEPEGKSVVRTFRVDRAWDNAMQEEAEKRGIAISNLLEQVVKDYIHFYRWVDSFGSVIFSPNTIKTLVDELSEESLKLIGERVGKTSTIEGFLLKGEIIDREIAIYQIVEQMGHYSHWFTATAHDSDKPYLYIQHSLGPKWTTFIEAYISSFYSNVLDIKVKSQRIGDNLVIRIVE